MRMVLLVAVLLTACGGSGAESGDDPVVQSPPATTAPAASEGEGEILQGTLGGDASLEGGCAWLDDGSQRWEVQYPQGYTVSFDPLTLTGPDGATASEGDTITVTGAPVRDVVTICQVGPVWGATTVDLSN